MISLINLVFVFIITAQVPSIEERVKFLQPEVKPDTAKMVADVLTTWMPKVGLDNEDLILSIIHKESAFIHKWVAGADGEWGMLQVIPNDTHIQRAALKYRCTLEEQKIKYSFKDEWGDERYVGLCRCPEGQEVGCDLPNIGYFKENKYIVSTLKLRNFLRLSARGALVTGLYELKFWKNKYDSKLKQRYWTSFPKYLFGAEEVDTYQKWWKQTKSDLGDNLWIVHHNYGSQIKKSHVARWYPRMVYKQYQRLLIFNKREIGKKDI